MQLTWPEFYRRETVHGVSDLLRESVLVEEGVGVYDVSGISVFKFKIKYIFSELKLLHPYPSTWR